MKGLIEREVWMQLNAGNVVELLLPYVPDQDIVRKYHQAPVKVTDSEIERMLQHLKDDVADDIIIGKKQEEVRNFDENVLFKTTQGVRVSGAVVTMDDAPRGEVTEETLDVEEGDQEEFNTWFGVVRK